MDVTVDGSEDYVIGVDYGTLSGRAVVVRVRDGRELGNGVFDYPHAVVSDALPEDTAGAAGETTARLAGEWALQVPNDYRTPPTTNWPAGSKSRRAHYRVEPTG